MLEGLKKDSDQQCHCILKATKMGQEATQELAKLQEEYNVTEKSVRSSMKERDRAIRNLKSEIEYIKAHHAHIPKVDLVQEAQRVSVYITGVQNIYCTIFNVFLKQYIIKEKETMTLVKNNLKPNFS